MTCLSHGIEILKALYGGIRTFQICNSFSNLKRAYLASPDEGCSHPQERRGRVQEDVVQNHQLSNEEGVREGPHHHRNPAR